MRIVWTLEALLDYESIIDYLIYKWSLAVAEDFINSLDQKIKLIQLQPELFEKVNYKNVRRAVIKPPFALFYRIEPEEIILLRLWNNSQNPDKLNL